MLFVVVYSVIYIVVYRTGVVFDEEQGNASNLDEIGREDAFSRNKSKSSKYISSLSIPSFTISI